ncbi:hypothetical protein [Nucisporomicrobium flavum]|uniref:hypothetical protein n=1 Tax=Nucisporomicrobium flavum TaxID=2785915 RepID=UPI0018F69BEC|nr:hypothetical protein [Nucisporomicrobium flavum]
MADRCPAGVRIVLAGRVDRAAARLAAEWDRWAPAVLMTPADVCRAGWAWTGDIGASRWAAGGRIGTGDDILGVYVRIPVVLPGELPHLRRADRGFAAQETHAFLLAWLAGLGTRVLNRPTPGNLAGPDISRAAWLRTAGSVLGDDGGRFTGRLDVVAGRTIQRRAPAPLRSWFVPAVAERVGAGTFTMALQDGRITGATCWPALRAPARRALFEAVS